ncbi:hypothetical protein BJ138DRAFT_1107665 [Hygrophoropsis aurantiaca]|uniref:Uncharacterized protein n=1 Tax=Hygrophoropsis aurantiaca TaxID=72124 RepID=A0ACB7ZSX2_9AGAM|nr:hypothetical protein BJ138DRAFT_1107665 [Hygrophoropsis aurantiaca]
MTPSRFWMVPFPMLLHRYWMRLNVDNQIGNALTESSSNPDVTMSQYQMENVVAQIAAEAIWMAGQVGGGGGGFSRLVGETSIMQYTLQWRLNINLAPVMTGRGRTGTHKPDGLHTVKSASPLELLWLAAHMPGLTAGFKDVERPTINNLREAGMFDVCMTDNDDATDTQQYLDHFCKPERRRSALIRNTGRTSDGGSGRTSNSGIGEGEPLMDGGVDR